MAFICLSFLELIHSLNLKSENSIFKVGVLKNWYLIGAILLGIILQLAVVVIPSFSKIFNTVSLNSTQWIYVTLISILPIIIIEIQKKINEIRFGKVLYKIPQSSK